MTAPVIQPDIAIIGGGIAGLWALCQLRNAGYQAVLFEQEALGSYQTVGSQGMIHGGIKYALSGALSNSSETISSMPGVWRECLAGNGKVDLRNCEVLSEDFYLWSDTGLTSRVGSFFASKLLRGRVDRLAPADYPAVLANPAFKGQVYRLIDLVLDAPSLVKTLADQSDGAIFSIDWNTSSLAVDSRQAIIDTPFAQVRPRQLILAAGAGNEGLVQALGGSSPAMQRRPLQQVIVKHEYPEPFFGHCTGGSPSPRLTVSSHRTSAGEPVWYLGGDLSTEGADWEPQRVIERAKAELDELFPWIDFGHCEWRTLRLDRGEPRQSALKRPDTAYVGAVDSVDNALVTWPTKLTLSPDLGNELEHTLARRDMRPGPSADLAPLAGLGQPPIASAPWDTLFS
ncbi:glycerol-3-phosphate dehydrogenase [Halioglobus japonicus]|uniref:FAD-dependent oxidoreductase n=1 Tax=Halioglobus japonicus TaxID=930805 RepID=A0AAP8SM39_9GAMM|nr:FAD-dependent oxidoreductase [Halioglobus japonicus]AQA17241.1 glycerol-3-phosphate dehydrogenase [Halioglobus japonicus]PLW85157.1 FAD-dependent oxidoreductase [Halioglobus japonicus]GHD19744.1 FAD-dependent oxidoreductase [Halioglobus japonicus]